ncbi:hypothetical protein GCM10008171_33300 [Methylopila jiangsuensis]|uniref:Uncharacterized protein n=1 Tax=Methylopila jiangsuensis TaxID=586230 RepID=A0A9W6JI52_9HYPH|nr:hypothetical protein [Methylopila jiangsuensis]MDR6284536.1 hypothetical protein [Methylopila jiangsuensis]GLK78076.1 hypothetical protein GCM10008171_33300 [Methylopila jiangsuensis]
MRPDNLDGAYQVEHWRRGVRGYEVTVRASGISVARTAFWAVVDQRGGSLHEGDQLLLRHGARVILTYPPEARVKDGEVATSRSL